MRRDLAIIVGLAVLLMAASLIAGPFPIDSAAYNAVWTQQWGEAMAHGQWWPRWLPGSFEGLGAPTFYFYPPLAFLLTGGLNAAGLTVGAAINLEALIVLTLSGLSMYGWLRFRGGRALIGAVLFMALPYHLADFYKRAAIAEFSGFVWIPLIAIGIEAAPRRWAGPLLAVSFAGLILTHLPTALLTAIFLILPMVVRAAATRRDWKEIAGYALAGLAGGLLAAPYLAPALGLQDFISSGLLWAPFFQPGNWSPYAHAGVQPAILRWPAVMAGVSAVLAGTAGWLAWKAGRREVVFWSGLALAAAVLGLALVPGFWRLPLIDKVQFPWRVFVIMEFAAASAVALSPRLPKLAMQAAGVIAVAAYVRVGAIVAQTAAGYVLPPELPRTLPDAPEYLPAGIAPQIVANGRDADVSPLRWDRPVMGPASNVQMARDGTMRIQADGTGTVIVRRFSFPIWAVERDGKPVKTRIDGPLIAFGVEPGEYRVVRRRLTVERMGWEMGLAGLVLLPLLAIRRRRKA